MAITWNEVKRNETPDFRSTVESRLRTSGVLDAIRLASLMEMRHHYESETNRANHADTGPDNQGENIISPDV